MEVCHFFCNTDWVIVARFRMLLSYSEPFEHNVPLELDSQN